MKSAGCQVLAIPFARTSHSYAATQAVDIPVDNDDVLKLSQVHSDTPTVFLAIWQTLLVRYANDSEVVVSCMRHVGAEVKITQVVTEFSASMPFLDLLERARGWLSADETTVAPQAQADGCAIGFVVAGTPAISSNTPDPFQIAVRVHQNRDWRVQLEYDPSCLVRETAERMARSYAALVRGVTANPQTNVDDLPIFSPVDYSQVVEGFNQAKNKNSGKCVHELFEEQVTRTPSHTALRFHDLTLTYNELNVRANQLAHFLRRRGVRPNVPVALFVERSAEMIIGLLAAIKAGGCYVPFVHDDPPARISSLLAEVKAPVLLTTEKLRSRLPQYTGEVVLLDMLYDTEPSTSPENQTSPDDLVCIIYTSGSTGVPKGVAARHANLANYIHFICRRLGNTEGWNFATVSTINAILGNTSVFGSLMSGGCLHVIDYETAMSPNSFADYLESHSIDVLKITPAQISSLLSGAGGRRVVPRKYLVIGGERFTFELLRQIQENGNCRVMNHYGPTETMGCCTFTVDDYDFDKWQPGSVPLGRPMENQNLYVLDQHLRPVPIGVAGELCVMGQGVTAGYWNAPEQTAERFVASPFGSATRLYRTGDLARLLPDGNIEYLGRVDHQVKIRGFRVEPAEIEAALKKHPCVKEAVVLSADNDGSEKTLAAYVVGTEMLDGSILRSFLREQLPEYMVPTRICMLQSLPLNRNGKVDLYALSQLRDEERLEVPNVDGPRNPTEEELRKIWIDVLRKESIGINDDFFEIGGHSLLAIRVMTAIRNVFRVQLPLFTFLENPTIAGLAAKIGEHPVNETEEQEIEQLLRELDGMSGEAVDKLIGEPDEVAPEAQGSTD